MAGNAWVQNGTCSEFQVTCMQPKRRVRGLEVFYYFSCERKPMYKSVYIWNDDIFAYFIFLVLLVLA